MTWLLDKQFQFTSPYSLEQCEKFLFEHPKPKRFLMPHSIALISSSKSNGNNIFKLGRDVGRGLYAEVIVELYSDNTGRVIVNGYGRIHRVSAVLFSYLFIAGIFAALVFRPVPFLSILFSIGAIVVIIFLILIVRNRNRLVVHIHNVLT